jgi:hypothetical protein
MNKLCKSRKFSHPNGINIDTPILVPSFSSKGFSFKEKKGEVLSETHKLVEMSKEYLHESMLVSAFDLHYGYIPSPKKFNCTEMTIIDSGGYETSDFQDLSNITKTNSPVLDWDINMLETTLKQWPKTMAGVIVNFDDNDLKKRKDIETQVSEARKFFKKFPDQASDFLIKPETETQHYLKKTIDKIVAEPNILNGFDILGVTEKEIGDSQLDRMENIARLRMALDKAGINSPIHIFGGLDPINIILYYVAGAEIFDGLTWLKLAYHNGAAIYTQNYFTLDQGVHGKHSVLKWKFFVDNLNFLEKMKYTLIEYANEADCKIFDDIDENKNGISKIVEKAYSQLLNKIQ